MARQAARRLAGTNLRLAGRCYATERYGPDSQYSILGVAPSASTADIKAAFRKKAKELHPDLAGDAKTGSGEQFARLLSAYQVLCDPYQRQLHDLSMNPAAGPMARDLGSEESSEDSISAEAWADTWLGQVVDARSGPLPVPRTQVEAVAQQLRGDLRSALRHAYLGPRLNMQEDEVLPPAFEAEERSWPGCGDVLQLVSGRTLLGCVRELHFPELPGQVAQEHLPQTPRSILDPGGSPELAPAQPDTHAVQSQATLSDRAGLSDAPDCGRAHAAADNGPRSTAEVLQDRQEQGGPHQLLELVVGDQRRALARFAPPLPGATSPLRGSVDILDPDGRLLARQKMGRVVLSRREEVKITVWGSSTQSKILRFLDFYAQIGGSKPVCVCQGRRAWLPPASMWLFPPRSAQHTIGGWYFEWPGQLNASHPMWVPPEVFVLLAAVDTVYQEASGARQRPGNSTAALQHGRQRLRIWREKAAEQLRYLRLWGRP